MTYIRLRMNWMNRVALAGLLIAFVLTTLVPTNAAAQPAEINLGTHGGINLNLRHPASSNDGKIYYYVDHNPGFNPQSFRHSVLDDLLNDGADTTATQEGNHDGSDDERSVIISRYTLVLPTLGELRTLRANQGNRAPSGWPGIFYNTARRSSPDNHTHYFIANDTPSVTEDTRAFAGVVFQVIFGPSQLSLPSPPINDQAYLSSDFVSVTLPEATGANAFRPFTYTLTPEADIPDGMSFNPATRVLSGTPTTDGIAMLTYTVTENVGDVSDTDSQSFTVRVITPGARPDELLLGTRNGVNLNLRFPVTTADDKTYYYLDENNNGGADFNDRIAHKEGNLPSLSSLLNGGDDVIDTQASGHDGSDDARSVVIGRYTLVLPSVGELQALHAQGGAPPNWNTDIAYHTATQTPELFHRTYNLGMGMAAPDVAGTVRRFVAFQVITRGSSLSLPAIDDQIFLNPRNTTFTLPEATGANAFGPMAYFLTPHANIPDGVSFDPDTRVLSGFPTTDGVTRLTYSVIDATGDIASQEFTVTVFTPGVRQDALNFGTVSDINLNLIFPVTTKDGKVYYYLDGNNDGISSDGNIISGDGDRIAHAEGGSSLNDLRHLLNHGNPVMETQTDGHNGNDDIRSVHVSIGTAGTITYALILPNLSELVRLRRDQGFSAPPNWSTDLRYHSANQNREYNLDTGLTANISPSIRRFVAFQVISLPAPPTSVTVTPGNGRFIVNWTPVPADNDGGAAITGYRVLIARSDGGGFIARPMVDGADANSHILTNLTNGTEYRVVINSINSRGNGIASASVFATPVPVPFVTITDDATADTANIADGDITFTFGWNEDVTDFTAEDISVTGGTVGSFRTTAANRTYTLVVTPNANTNDGIITITVAADAVTSNLTGLANIIHTDTLNYDTRVPDNPTFTTPVAEDNTINIAERDAGVALSGSLAAETGATAALCFSGGSGEACSGGGTLRDTTVTSTVWNYTLSTDDINAMGQGDEILTVTVMDAAGNPSDEVSHTINVDTSFPIPPIVCSFGSDGCSAGDNNINAAERAAGVTLTGTRADITYDIIICINDGGMSTDINCSSGDSYNPDIAGSDWSLTLNEAQLTPYGQGEFIVGAIAIDSAGNRSISPNRRLEVDTIPPAVPTIDVVAGDDIINAAERTPGPVEITGGGREAEAIVIVRFAGDDATCGSGTINLITGTENTWMLTLHNLLYMAIGEGSEILCVTATDAAGNVSDFGTRRISVDTVSPVFPGTSAPDMRETIFVGTGSSTDTEIYNAAARDNGRAVDIGISYTVGDIGADLFTIDEDSGVLTPLAQLSDVPTTYNVNIVATDEAGNPSTQFLTVDINEITMVTITDNVAAATANIADGDITFTFEWNEAVTGFVADDINVTGGIAGPLATTAAGMTYTLVVTPNANTNDGIITITVAADAVTSSLSNLGNIIQRYTQNYDTRAPDNPTFTTPVTEDNIINSVEQDAGVALSGSLTVETGATAVLCFSGGTGEACTDRTLRDAAVNGAVWSYTLSIADVNAMGQGDETLTVTAYDPAGNPSADVSHTINVDTVLPVFPMPNPTTTRETVFAGIGSSTNTEIYNAEATDNGRAADIGISYTVGDIGADLFTIDEDSGVLTPRAQLSAVPTTHDVNIVATDEAGNPSTYFLTVGIVAAGISIHDLRAGGNEISMVTIADEDGGTSTFYVQLTSAPQTGSVVIGIVSSDTGEGTVTPPSLTFSGTTWDDRQAVTITAIDDSKDGDDSFTVDFNISAGDGNLYLTTLNLPSVAVTVTNDDIALFFRIKVFLEGAQ